MNIKLILILSITITGFSASSMDLHKSIDLSRPHIMRRISDYVTNVRRCDRAHAECYLADLHNGEIIECSKYYENGTIICTHSISFFDTKPDLISEKYFSILKKISEKKFSEQTTKKKSTISPNQFTNF